MFGNNNENMGDMMAKLQQMQEALDDTKKRLETINIQGKTPDGNIRFVMDGNRKLKEITIINKSILSPENKEEIEDMLVVAFNRALEETNIVNEQEMQNNASGLFPGL